MRTVSTAEFVGMIKAGRVKAVLPMIAEKARLTWHNLPKQEQLVSSLDDLIQAGINFTVTKAVDEFNPRKGTKFSTFLFLLLDRFYVDILREVYAKKRCYHHAVFSLDTSVVDLGNGSVIPLSQKLALTRKRDYETLMINRIDAERGFVKIYAHASPLLRRYLIRWIMQPAASRQKKGSDFRDAQQEFRQLARKFYFNRTMCQTVSDDHICRRNVADKLCLSVHTPRKSKVPENRYVSSEEFALRSIVSPATICKLIPVIA